MNFTEFRLLLKNNSFSFWNEVHKHALLSREDMESLSWERTLALFRYAYNNIPFYHEKYSAAGVESEHDVKSWADFQKLPILEKEEVRTHYKSMIAEGDSLDSLIKASTGGSTGEPLQVWRTPKLDVELLMWPIMERVGIRYSDSVGIVSRGACSELHRKITNFLMYPRQYFGLDAYKVLTPDMMRTFAKKLCKIKAKYIRGYLGAIQQFAEFCEAEKLELPKLTMVWTSCSPLAANVRAYLSHVFNCPVYTQYGCCEMPVLALECEKQCGMHVLPYARKIEIVGPNLEQCDYGVTGNIIITDLLEKRFPLIRYQNGDRASWIKESCSCGLNLPLMSYVIGRILDCFVFKDGSCYDAFSTAFDDYPYAVKAFQFFQSKDTNVTLRVVRNPSHVKCDEEIKMVADRFEKLLAGRALFKLEEMSAIPHDQGKTRYIIREK